MHAQERDKLTSAAESSTRLRIAQQEAAKLQEQLSLLSTSNRGRLLALLQQAGAPGPSMAPGAGQRHRPLPASRMCSLRCCVSRVMGPQQRLLACPC